MLFCVPTYSSLSSTCLFYLSATAVALGALDTAGSKDIGHLGGLIHSDQKIIEMLSNGVLGFMLLFRHSKDRMSPSSPTDHTSDRHIYPQDLALSITPYGPWFLSLRLLTFLALQLRLSFHLHEYPILLWLRQRPPTKLLPRRSW